MPEGRCPRVLRRNDRLGSQWVLSGFSWVLMGTHGFSVGSHGFSWVLSGFSVGSHGFSVGTQTVHFWVLRGFSGRHPLSAEMVEEAEETAEAEEAVEAKKEAEAAGATEAVMAAEAEQPTEGVPVICCQICWSPRMLQEKKFFTMVVLWPPSQSSSGALAGLKSI